MSIVKSLLGWFSPESSVQDYDNDPLEEAAKLLSMSREDLTKRLAESPDMTKTEMLEELGIDSHLYGFIRRAQNTDLRTACCNVVGIDEEVFLEYTKWVSMSDSEKLALLVREPKDLVHTLSYVYKYYLDNRTDSERLSSREQLEQAKLMLLDLRVRDLTRWNKQQHTNLVSEIISRVLKYYILYYKALESNKDEKDTIPGRRGDRKSNQ